MTWVAIYGEWRQCKLRKTLLSLEDTVELSNVEECRLVGDVRQLVLRWGCCMMREGDGCERQREVCYRRRQRV